MGAREDDLVFGEGRRQCDQDRLAETKRPVVVPTAGDDGGGRRSLQKLTEARGTYGWRVGLF